MLRPRKTRFEERGRIPLGVDSIPEYCGKKQLNVCANRLPLSLYSGRFSCMEDLIIGNTNGGYFQRDITLLTHYTFESQAAHTEFVFVLVTYL